MARNIALTCVEIEKMMEELTYKKSLNEQWETTKVAEAASALAAKMGDKEKNAVAIATK